MLLKLTGKYPAIQCLAVNIQFGAINEPVHKYPPVAVFIANSATYGNCVLVAWLPLEICNFRPFETDSLPLKTKSSTFSGFSLMSKVVVSWLESADTVKLEEKIIFNKIDKFLTNVFT